MFDAVQLRIKCGTGYLTDLTQAAAAVGDQNYVAQCEDALLARRLWTVPPGRAQRRGVARGDRCVGGDLGA